MDGRRTDAGVTGILIAHLGAFGSGELTIKTANSVFEKSLHTDRLLIISAYFQKYEIFVYGSAKQAMDETFFQLGIKCLKKSARNS